MTPIKRKISYRLSGERLILRVRWNGIIFERSTGLDISPLNKKGIPQWDGSRCTPNSSHGKSKVHASHINNTLIAIENNLDQIFYSFELKDEVPSKQQLAAALGNEDATHVETFEKIFDTFLRDGERQNAWAFNTVKSIHQIKKLVLQFDPNVKLSDINERWLDKFVEYQKQTRYISKLNKNKDKTKNKPKDEPDGYANTVILKNCRILSWFLKWAAEKGYVKKQITDNFKPKLKTVSKPVIFLRWNELMRLLDLQLTPGSIEDKTRDIFCFCCFTSLRYSDADNLTKTQVYDDYIDIVTVKTNTLLRIDLNDYSRAILQKYAGSGSTRALPHVNLRDMNYHLKKLAAQAEINEPITVTQYFGNERRTITKPKSDFLSSHCGRRTFICNALALGISPSIVMKWTGHSEYSAMRPYIDIADDIRRSSMQLFNIARHP